MPPRHGRYRPPPRRPTQRESRPSTQVQFIRRAVPLPSAPIVLRMVAPAPDADEPAGEQWELTCRDGWEWRFTEGNRVLVRVAQVSAEQAQIIQDWIQRIQDPAVWWAVSRELHSPDSSPDVARALRASPWLTQVLPVLLEASTEGAPPPPP